MSTAAIWATALGVLAALFFVLLVIALAGDQQLAAENRRLRKALAVHHPSNQKPVAYDEADLTDLNRAVSPADIQWGGDVK